MHRSAVFVPIVATLAAAAATAVPSVASRLAYLEVYPGAATELAFASEACSEGVSIQAYKADHKVVNGEVDGWHVYARCTKTTKPSKRLLIPASKRMAHVYVTMDARLEFTYVTGKQVSPPRVIPGQ